MKNFERVETGVDAAPFLKEIEENRADTAGKVIATSHDEAAHIRLRAVRRTEKNKNVYSGNVLETAPTKHYPRLPYTTTWLERFAREHDGTLECAFVAILQPHGKVHLHYDAGRYFAITDRYHLVLQSEGTRVLVGEEISVFRKGEIWWFNNMKFHEFSHDSDAERIHLIFDVRPRSYAKRCARAVAWRYFSVLYTLQGANAAGGPPCDTGPK